MSGVAKRVRICAICTSTRGPFTREPLGKNDALVAVCSDCTTQRPASVFGPEMGYEPNDPRITWQDARSAVAPRANLVRAVEHEWHGAERKKFTRRRPTGTKRRVKRESDALARVTAKVGR